MQYRQENILTKSLLVYPILCPFPCYFAFRCGISVGMLSLSVFLVFIPAFSSPAAMLSPGDLQCNSAATAAVAG